MKITKRILSIVMVVVTLISVVSISAEAASITTGKINLGYMAPTNAKATKVLETVKLYGDNDYINFYINSKKNDSYFFYEICSDAEGTKAVCGDVVYCNKGSYTYSAKIKLKGSFKSKTYYLFTYAAKIYSDGSAKVDLNSMSQYKITVKRNAAFKEKIVILNGVKNTYNGPQITWSGLGGATKYIVYRRSITGTKWTKVGTVGGSKRSFTDTSVKNKNDNFIYSVMGVNKSGAKSRYLYSGLTCLYAKAPVISSVSVKPDNAIQIKWGHTKSSGVKYTIMRKEGDGSWKTIKSNFTGNTYTDKSAKNGKTYRYTVRATISTKYGNKTSGYYPTNGKAVTYLKAPVLNGVQAVETGANVSWKAVSGAKGYTIYRKNADTNSGWKKIGVAEAGATSFVDTTALTDGVKYLYTVRSEAAKNNGSYLTAGVEYIYTAPETTVPDTTLPEVIVPEVTVPEVTEPTTEQVTEPDVTIPSTEQVTEPVVA